MSSWNRNPEWLPGSADGTVWEFRSYRGRFLGVILKVDGRWLAHKFCCNIVKHYDRMYGAAGYVETTLSCGDCNGWRPSRTS